LISEEQAEGLIETLENSKVGKAVSRAKAAGSPYLLTPLLETPEGRNGRENGDATIASKPKAESPATWCHWTISKAPYWTR
jgi:hypothetical protein